MKKEDSFKNIEFFLDFINPCSTYCIWVDIISLKADFLDYIEDDLEIRKRIDNCRDKKIPYVYIEVFETKTSALIYEDKNITYSYCLDTKNLEYFQDKELEDKIDYKKAAEELALLFNFLKNK